MTIVMEEDAFSSSLSSLSTLSPQSNYESLIGRDSLNSTYLNSSLNQQMQQQQQQQQQQSKQIYNRITNTSPLPNELNQSNSENCPYAVFIFRSNNNNNNNTSELFEERRISLEKPCKIGRSVAKIRPEPNNAIFDCKVLSRNHALLWEEKGKFYLQDTKSSNGTFLNGNRLGKSNEDSVPYELTSGDIIQFGVDVTENTKKVTHGCITVEVRLFHRPGQEALNKPNQQNNKVDVQTQELYQLALFLQEAMMREEILNQKLRSLQSFIDQAKETSENGWVTLIQEDRLLSRIDSLEKQTNLNNKNLNEEQFKKTICNLREEKSKIENSAKETIQKMIEEKNELAQKLDEIKTMYNTQDEECNQLQKLNDELRTKILELAGKNQELISQIDNLQVDLEELKLKYNEKLNSADLEKQNYETQLNEMIENEKKLTAQVELLIAEKDIQSKQLEGLLLKYEQTKKLNEKKTEKIETNLNENFEQKNSSLNENKQVELEEPTELFDKKFIVTKAEVLNDVSNNLNNNNNTELERLSPNKDLVNNNSNNLIKNLIDENEKENLKITEKLLNENELLNVNNVNSNSNSNNNNLSNKENNLIQFNIEIDKLNKEIENLNLRLNDEIEINNQLSIQLDHFKNINENTNRIDILEKELEEKNLLINQLLISKNDLINLNFKNLLNSPKSTETSFDLNLNNLSSNQDEQANTIRKSIGCSNEYYNLKDEFNQLKNQIQIIEFTMQKCLEDRGLNTDENNKKEEYFSYLEDSCKKLKELKDNLDDKETRIDSNLTDAQKEADLNIKKIVCLETRIKELEEICDDYKSKLDTSHNVLETMNEGYDNLSLRAKIVSYFSMIPLCFLIFAIMVAFYPTLATITATGL